MAQTLSGGGSPDRCPPEVRPVAVPSFLARDRIVARPGFNRWLIPPAALAVHLCIGQAYATSVYKTALVEHFDSTLTAIGIIFSIAIVMLGVSAALFGTWVDRNGPRAAMFTSACFWVTGFLVGGLGIETGQLWLLYFGYGFLGGIGLGIGYISPVSTLIKWFPDRPRLATGMAIMGFGGGALIASPLSRQLWTVLFCTVPAGLGILEQAAPMIQDFFRNGETSTVAAATAAGFVGLLSLFNMAGRFVWSSTSDFIGRKPIYMVYLGVGMVLYVILAILGSTATWIFVLTAAIIISFYGGGVATVPAHLRGLFGTHQVGAIHGRLLTAWGAAGVAGA